MLKTLGLNKSKKTNITPPLLPILFPIPPLTFYSTSKLSTWTGHCVKVVRAADSAELDIGFLNNKIDMGSAMAFAGTSNLTIKTWYDQSGNGHDLTQSTIANQPALNPDWKPITNGMQSITINGARTTPVARKFLTNSTVSITENSFETLMCICPEYSYGSCTYETRPPSTSSIALSTNVSNMGLWTVNNGVSQAAYVPPAIVPPQQPCVIGHSGYTNEMAVYLDGTRRTWTGGGTNTRIGFDLGAFTSTAGNHINDGRFNIFSYVTFATRLTTAERAAVTSELNRTGGVISGQANKVVWLGDSRTEGWGSLSLLNIPNRAYNKFSKKPYMLNLAVGGRTVAQELTAFSAFSGPRQTYDATKRNILVINGMGINDFGASRTAAQVQADIISICNSARTTGFKIHISTVPQSNGVTGSKETERLAYNSWLSANWATYADAFIDIAADPNIGTYNTTHYYDNAHYKDSGYDIWANLVYQSIESLMV